VLLEQQDKDMLVVKLLVLVALVVAVEEVLVHLVEEVE
jgi:hypothetical protein